MSKKQSTELSKDNYQQEADVTNLATAPKAYKLLSIVVTDDPVESEQRASDGKNMGAENEASLTDTAIVNARVSHQHADHEGVDEMRRASKKLTTALTAIDRELGDLSHSHRSAAIVYLQQALNEIADRYQSGLVPDLPEPGGKYEVYEKRSDAYAHLEKHWGTWLQRYNPDLDRDYLHQDQLRLRDPALVRALFNQLPSRKAGEKVSDYVPAGHKRRKQEYQNLTASEKEAVRRFRYHSAK